MRESPNTSVCATAHSVSSMTASTPSLAARRRSRRAGSDKSTPRVRSVYSCPIESAPSAAVPRKYAGDRESFQKTRCVSGYRYHHAGEAGEPGEGTAPSLPWKSAKAAPCSRSCQGPCRLDGRDENLFERQRLGCQRCRRTRFQARRQVGGVSVDDDFNLAALPAQHLRTCQIERARIVGEARMRFSDSDCAPRPHPS